VIPRFRKKSLVAGNAMIPKIWKVWHEKETNDEKREKEGFPKRVLIFFEEIDPVEGKEEKRGLFKKTN
jgi:hypothetical protein